MTFISIGMLAISIATIFERGDKKYQFSLLFAIFIIFLGIISVFYNDHFARIISEKNICADQIFKVFPASGSIQIHLSENEIIVYNRNDKTYLTIEKQIPAIIQKINDSLVFLTIICMIITIYKKYSFGNDGNIIPSTDSNKFIKYFRRNVDSNTK